MKSEYAVPNVKPPCAPTQALEQMLSGQGTGALHPSRHRLLCQLVELALSCQSRLAPFEGGLVSLAPAGFVPPGWSCCAARCWLVPQGLLVVCDCPQEAHLDEENISSGRQGGGAGAGLPEVGH